MGQEIPTEVKTLLSDWKPLTQSYDLASWAYDNARRKDATWIDQLVFIGSAVYFGYNVVKTVEDGQKAYQALVPSNITVLTRPRPVKQTQSEPISVHYYMDAHARIRVLQPVKRKRINRNRKPQ